MKVTEIITVQFTNIIDEVTAEEVAFACSEQNTAQFKERMEKELKERYRADDVKIVGNQTFVHDTEKE